MIRGALLALLLLEGIASADDALALARKAVAESDYAAARTELAAARDAGGRGPEDTAELYRLSGIVSAALGDAKAASDAFEHLLAMAPKSTLPAGTSPKITRPFEAARRYVTSHGVLELKLETSAAPPVITLVLVSDPLSMVARAHVVFSVDGGAEQVKDVAASERTEIALPAGGRIDARVAALDVHGNHLVELGSNEVPVVIVGEKPAPVAPVVVAPVARIVPARPRPIYLRWWPYAAAAVAFGGAAGYFGWQARSDSDELQRLVADSLHHRFSEAQAVEDRGHRDVLLTNIGLGAAGAFAIAAGVLYLTAPRAHVETRVTAVPARGGGAIVFGGNF